MKNRFASILLIALSLFLCACGNISSSKEAKEYSELTKSFIGMLDQDPELKAMMIESIEKAKAINPDPETNPGQTLEQYYDFIEWSGKCLPWEVINQPVGRTLFNKLDQSLCYAYFVFDQPLDELKDKGYYYPSLQYHEPIRSWLIEYAKTWGKFLSTPESWNDDCYEAIAADSKFNMDKGWYESPSKWHSFNDFFHRYLSSPEMRPVSSAKDNSILVSPADSKPQGVWAIGDNSNLIHHDGAVIKSARVVSVRELVGETSEYRDSFACGTLFHTFLNVNDYHRYHFPLAGTIKEIEVIAGDDAAGGITVWDKESGNYILECETPGWQMIETRGRIILETPEFGLVALLPIGMSQVSSVNFENNLHPGTEVKKGDPMGWFDMGGSDFVLLFQKGVKLDLQVPRDGDGTYSHLYQGNTIGALSK